MTQLGTVLLVEILRHHQQEILNEWLQLQLENISTRRDLISDSELRQQSRDFLGSFTLAVSSGERFEAGTAWTPVRELLSRISETRARQGFTMAETAGFVLSLKQ